MWWKRWRYLTRAIDEQNHQKLIEAKFKFQLALVSSANISTESFSEIQKEAAELFYDLEGNLRPWLGRDRKERKEQEVQTFKQQWKELAGFDLSDKAAVEKWSEELKKVTQAKVESRNQAEQQEQQKQADFYRKLEEIRLKRLSQQGRRR